MEKITRKDEAIKLIKEGKLKLIECNSKHRADRAVVLTAVQMDGAEIDSAILLDIEPENEVEANNTFLMEAIKVANLKTPNAVATFKQTIDIYSNLVDSYIKKSFKQLTDKERRDMVKTYKAKFYTALAVAYAKQEPKYTIESAKEAQKKVKTKKIPPIGYQVTRKEDAIRLLKGGMLKLIDCNDRHRKDEEVVSAAVKRDGAEIQDAYLEEMEQRTEINADNTFLMKAISISNLSTKTAVAVFGAVIHVYAQDKDKYIRKTFKKLKDSERRKMVKAYEGALEGELAERYAKQEPLKVIEFAVSRPVAGGKKEKTATEEKIVKE